MNADSRLAVPRRIVAWLSVCAGMAQVIIETSVANVASTVLVIVAANLCSFVLLRRSHILRCPFSVFPILFFVFSNSIIPLVVLTCERRPIVYNLAVPVLTFSLVLLWSCCFLIAHAIYRRSRFLQGTRGTIAKAILTPMQIFAPPSSKQLWAIGATGAASLAVVIQFGNIYESGIAEGLNTSSPLLKLVQAITPFAWVPFCSLFPRLYGAASDPTRRQYAAIAVYSFVLATLSVALNSRGVFVSGVFTVALWVVLSWCVNVPLPGVFKRRTIIIAGIVLFLVSDVLGRFALAVELAREFRGKVPPAELLATTLEIAKDRKRIAAYASSKKLTAKSDWNEEYTDNPFFSRLINIKFLDNCLQLVEHAPAGTETAVWRQLRDRTFAILPRPLLQAAGIEVNKGEALSNSFGDLVFDQVSGTGLGGLRVGSVIAQLWFLLGFATFAAIIPAAALMFTLFDSFCSAEVLQVSQESTGARRTVTKYQYSIFGLTFVWTFMQVTTADSASDAIALVLRNIPQNVILYMLLVTSTWWLKSKCTKVSTQG